MSTLTLDLDEALMARLAERAQRAGVAPEALAQAALAGYLADEDPLAFVGAGEAPGLAGRRVDELLSEGYAGAQ
jgi:hypothetical protein